MKVLYGIQGTGNGHITRAKEILPALERRAHVDILVSGMHSEIALGYPIRYRAKGLGFKFGKRGGIDVLHTWWHSNVARFLREIEHLDLSSYDLVINDFEPVSAWAARRQHVPCVGLSNQCALSDPRISRPGTGRKHLLGQAVLKHYAPADVAHGFHYQALSPFIHTPVIRSEIRMLSPTAGDFYLVYLPFYADDKIIRSLQRIGGIRWVVFSKHSRSTYHSQNVTVMPVNGNSFTSHLARCAGVLSAAGFGITTEALFLGKKLMVIPMRNQYEQACNAHQLNLMGIPSLPSLAPKNEAALRQWITEGHAVKVDYPDHTAQLVDRILSDFQGQQMLMDDLLAEHAS